MHLMIAVTPDMASMTFSVVMWIVLIQRFGKLSRQFCISCSPQRISSTISEELRGCFFISLETIPIEEETSLLLKDRYSGIPRG